MVIHQVEKQVREFTPFQSPLLDGFYQSFLDILRQKQKQGSPIPAGLEVAMQKSDELRQEIQAAAKLGKNAYKQAKWIGLDGYVSLRAQLLPRPLAASRSNKKNRGSQLNRHMVETKSLRERGRKTGALEEEFGDTLLLGSNWNRVCAPEKSGKMISLVFWDKTGPEDKPSWDKQVGACGRWCAVVAADIFSGGSKNPLGPY